jgi:hypothetical protein
VSTANVSATGAKESVTGATTIVESQLPPSHLASPPPQDVKEITANNTIAIFFIGILFFVFISDLYIKRSCLCFKFLNNFLKRIKII